MNGNSNLPPGCTDADIERAAGAFDDEDHDIVECWRCRRIGSIEQKWCQWCSAPLDEPAP